MSVVALAAHPRYAPADVALMVDRSTLSTLLAQRGLPKSRAQIEKWKSQGMPCEPDGPGRRSWFDTDAVFGWLESQGYDVARLVQPTQREAN